MQKKKGKQKSTCKMGQTGRIRIERRELAARETPCVRGIETEGKPEYAPKMMIGFTAYASPTCIAFVRMRVPKPLKNKPKSPSFPMTSLIVATYVNGI